MQYTNNNDFFFVYTYFSTSFSYIYVNNIANITLIISDLLFAVDAGLLYSHKIQMI